MFFFVILDEIIKTQDHTDLIKSIFGGHLTFKSLNFPVTIHFHHVCKIADVVKDVSLDKTTTLSRGCCFKLIYFPKPTDLIFCYRLKITDRDLTMNFSCQDKISIYFKWLFRPAKILRYGCYTTELEYRCYTSALRYGCYTLALRYGCYKYLRFEVWM